MVGRLKPQSLIKITLGWKANLVVQKQVCKASMLQQLCGKSWQHQIRTMSLSLVSLGSSVSSVLINWPKLSLSTCCITDQQTHCQPSSSGQTFRADSTQRGKCFKILRLLWQIIWLWIFNILHDLLKRCMLWNMHETTYAGHALVIVAGDPLGAPPSHKMTLWSGIDTHKEEQKSVTGSLCHWQQIAVLQKHEWNKLFQSTAEVYLEIWIVLLYLP